MKPRLTIVINPTPVPDAKPGTVVRFREKEGFISNREARSIRAVRMVEGWCVFASEFDRTFTFTDGELAELAEPETLVVEADAIVHKEARAQ